MVEWKDLVSTCTTHVRALSDKPASWGPMARTITDTLSPIGIQWLTCQVSSSVQLNAVIADLRAATLDFQLSLQASPAVFGPSAASPLASPLE